MNDLKNQKILVFAPELENEEYRGIAVYTKSLIKALSNSGAELWLVTSFNSDDLKINKFNESSRNYIFCNEILQSFYKGNYDIKNNIKFYKKNILLRFLYGYIKKNKLLFYLIIIIKIFLKSNKYDKQNTEQIKFIYKNDNPYLKFEKLSFMKNISGFLTAPDISMNFKYIPFFPFKNKIQFDLDYFDCYITSEPLSLVSNNNIPIFQTIHDLIPLEFNTRILNIKSFYRKIKYADKNKKIFVSEVTQDKFNYLINNKFSRIETSKYESVIIQPPSLEFKEIKFYDNYKNILNSISIEKDSKIINSKKKSKKKSKEKSSLQPFKYFLFNASIDSRKNVLLLIESFINSMAQKKGIYLVIVGQLKNDAYSKEIRKMILVNSGIYLTGYVNNSKKSALYLNALCLLSPSIIEGFGIPVLDACCLGLNCVASDIGSHKEIQNLFDFRKHLILYPPKSLTEWYKVFYDQKFLNEINIDNIIKNRLLRYEKYKKLIEENFRFKLENLINNK